MELFLYLLTVFFLILGAVLSRFEKKQLVQERVSNVLRTAGIEENIDEEEMKLPFSKRIILPIWKKLRKGFQKNVSNEKKEKIEIKLLQAGSPMGMTPVEFRLFQFILLVLLPLGFVAYTVLLNMAANQIIFAALIGIALALFYPSHYLKQKMVARNKKAQRELPDFVDLITVSIEAGLGFDSALTKVVSKRDGVLSDEFSRCLEEMRLGKTRKEALSGIRDRLNVEDLKTLIGSIIQAEQLGIGMVNILRIQSIEMREKRKQRAEEQSMKAPIKMLFPLVIFIFPCIFIVLLGPAVIGLLEMF